MSETAADSARDYSLTAQQAGELMAICSMPLPVRLTALHGMLADVGHDGVVRLFAQFIGLANSVAANAKDQAEQLLVELGEVHPYTAEKINMPCVLGALQGARLVHGIDASNVCHGCAFRHGSIANQCLPTTLDADRCSEPGEHAFLCHEVLSPCGEATQACRGFAQARRAATEALRKGAGT
ncbi:TPA: hypothetical protein R4K21_003125 [Stenotrophomonas maltophilia]|nr:hypothetical protein [Stenotrophomonas maltophilia]